MKPLHNYGPFETSIAKKTYTNKEEILIDCENMKKAIDKIIFRTTGTPELEDKNHAETVEKFRELVHAAMIELDTVSEYGII